jgi:hypothetical protein
LNFPWGLGSGFWNFRLSPGDSGSLIGHRPSAIDHSEWRGRRGLAIRQPSLPAETVRLPSGRGGKLVFAALVLAAMTFDDRNHRKVMRLPFLKSEISNL